MERRRYNKTEVWLLCHWRDFGVSGAPVQTYNKRPIAALQRLADKGIVTLGALSGTAQYYTVDPNKVLFSIEEAVTG